MNPNVSLMTVIALAAVWIGGCVYDPVYEGASCGEDGNCPEGYECIDLGKGERCYSGVARDGSEEPAVPDGDAGLDEGPDEGDPDGGDTAPDDGDQGPDCSVPDQDEDGYDAVACGGDDCDDTRDDVNPDAPELCDGMDNDCDGLTDTSDDDFRRVACDIQEGVCQGAAKPAELCVEGDWLDCRPEDFLANDGDYEAEETLCDGLDNDCDGGTDNDLVGPACSLDLGVCAGSTRACLGEAGWKESCDAGDYGSDYELVESLCDGLDNDCDGVTDGMIRSCEAEHFGECAKGDETCTEGAWAGCPEPGEELCEPAGLDEDCDGSIDEGCSGCEEGQLKDCPLQKGVCEGAKSECVSNQWMPCDYSAHSGGLYELPPEQSCDGEDNDCDGTVDGMSRACSIEHIGWCSVGSEVCVGAGTWEGCPEPQQEICDSFDNDCDGLYDAEDPDMILAPCEANTGVCDGEHYHDPAKCVEGQWNLCDATEYGPEYQMEVCADGLDNDCDGLTDCGPPECEGDARPCQNDCIPGEQICQGGAWGDCLPEICEESVAAANCSDGLDNECDGATDCADTDCEGAVRDCYNGCHPGHQTCQDSAWTACDALQVREERERNGNCDDGVDNDCDGHTDSDDDQCCGSVGVTGTLLLVVGLPFAIRRRRRR